MTKIKITSKMAVEGNKYAAELWETYGRKAASQTERVPYPTTVWVGEVESADLEDIFREFNRVTEADCERLEEIGYALPSLSVGDTVEVEGKTWLCAGVGWVEDHDCQENAVPYESDGALGHGWECGKCGAFLQAG